MTSAPYPTNYAAGDDPGGTPEVGVHACGLVITPGPVSDFVPVTSVKGTLVTQYDGPNIEGLGLLKMDILGLKTGAILSETCALVEKNHGHRVDLDKIPMDDQRVFDLFRRGHTAGIFQFESSGMQAWLKKLKPDSVEDLIAMNALYRPGPMDLIPSYIERKHGREEVDTIHPVFAETLGKTYGIPVYQEQVMQMARDMSGFTLGEADILRRAMGKKKPEEMAAQREKFVAGAVKNGVDANKANEVFDIIDKFAGYGFNRCIAGDTVMHFTSRLSDVHSNSGETVKALYTKLKTLAEDGGWGSVRAFLAAHHDDFDSGRIREPQEYRVINGNSGGSHDGGATRVVDVRYEGRQPVFKVTTESGASLRVTATHKFPVALDTGASGMMPLYLIQRGVHSLYRVHHLTSTQWELHLDPVVSIKPDGEDDVYDVEVADEPHVFAAGSDQLLTCNSHAAAYAILAYQEAYLRTHYPVEYMAAKLQHEAENADKKKAYLRVAKRIGVAVRPPSVNGSGLRFTPRWKDGQGTVYYGMSNVKYAGEAAVQQIIDEREANGEYASLRDFVERLMCDDGTKVTSRTVSALIQVGAFDEFGERANLLAQLDTWNAWSQKVRDYKRGRKKEAATGSRGAHRKSMPEPPAFDADSGWVPPPPAQLEEMLRWELELMGQYVSGHPMDGFDAAETLVERITGCPLEPLYDENGVEVGRKTFEVAYPRGPLYPIFGVITQVKEKTTKKGKPFAIVMIQDAADRTSKAFAWSETLERYGAHLREGAKVFAIAKVGGNFPDSLEAVVPAQDLISDWARFAVLKCRTLDQAHQAHALALDFGLAGGDCKVVYDVAGQMHEGPEVMLSPERVRKLDRIAPVTLHRERPSEAL